MPSWEKTSKTHVATMEAGDFAHNEKSLTLQEANSVNIEHTDDAGNGGDSFGGKRTKKS